MLSPTAHNKSEETRVENPFLLDWTEFLKHRPLLVRRSIKKRQNCNSTTRLQR